MLTQTLRQILEGDSNPKDSRALEEIESLIKASLLDPNPDIRTGLVRQLNRIFCNNLQGGYAADNQLFIIVREKDSEPVTIYVCEQPENYLGKKSNPKRFYRKP
jgi:hypothetical protein